MGAIMSPWSVYIGLTETLVLPTEGYIYCAARPVSAWYVAKGAHISYHVLITSPADKPSRSTNRGGAFPSYKLCVAIPTRPLQQQSNLFTDEMRERVPALMSKPAKHPVHRLFSLESHIGTLLS